MAVATVYIGRHAVTPEGDYAQAGEGQLRACVFDPTSEHLWAHTFEGRVGHLGNPATVFRWGSWDGSAGAGPDDRLGYSSEKTAATPMPGWDTGAVISAGVALSDLGISNLAIPIPQGTRVAIGALSDSGGLGLGMRQALFVDADDKRFFDRFGLSGTTLPAPFGPFSSSIQGHLTVALICDTNEEPRVPVNRTADPASGDLTPTLEGDHRDRNGPWGVGNDGADRGDYMKQYRIQWRRQSDGVVIWAPAAFTANASERTAERFARLYAGPALTPGVTYEWRAQTSDHFDAWGDWSTWLAYTPPNAGSLTLEGTPTGKQETTTPSPFQFRWHHAGGPALSMEAVRVRIKNGGAVIRLSAWITKTVAPEALGTATWAETGFSDLNPGDQLTYEVQGRDTALQETNWSTGRAFSINAAPSVPTGLLPDDDAVVTQPPLAIFLMSDTDPDDTPGTGLDGKLEIPSDAGALLVTRDATFNAATGRWERQLTDPGDLTLGFATYRTRAYGFDGTFYSGGVTVEANATRSAEARFIYAAGPNVSIVAPLDLATVNTSTPTFQWNAPTQTAFKLRIFAAAALIYQTNGGNWTSGSQQTHVSPSGYLEHGETYQWEIEVQDALALTGQAAASFTVQFTPPVDVPVSALPVKIKTDPWPTAIRLEWSTSQDPDFSAYLVYRSDLTNPLTRITSVSANAYVDPHPVSETEYTYTVRVAANRDGIEIVSPGSSAAAMVQLQGVILTAVNAPTTYRTVLASVQDRSHRRVGEEVTYRRHRAKAPMTWRSAAHYIETPGRYRLAPDLVTGVSVAERLAEIEELDRVTRLPLSEGGIGAVLCYRDERRRKRFVVIPAQGLEIFDERFRAEAQILFRDEDYQEGVV